MAHMFFQKSIDKSLCRVYYVYVQYININNVRVAALDFATYTTNAHSAHTQGVCLRDVSNKHAWQTHTKNINNKYKQGVEDGLGNGGEVTILAPFFAKVQMSTYERRLKVLYKNEQQGSKKWLK